VPEEQRLQHTFLGADLDPVDSPAAGEVEVLLDVEVRAVEPLRPAIVQDRPADVVFQQIRVGQVVIQAAVADAALLDDFLIDQNRLAIKRPGEVGILGGIGLLEGGVRLQEQGRELVARKPGGRG
jgi:hypothetical protein